MSADRIFCSECGTSNEADALYCESCGHKLDETEVAPAAVAAAPDNAAPAKRFPTRLVAVLALLFVTAGSAYAFRAPLRELIDSVRGGPSTATTTPAGDSLALAPAPGAEAAQLNDNPGVAPTGPTIEELANAAAPIQIPGPSRTTTQVQRPQAPATASAQRATPTTEIVTRPLAPPPATRDEGPPQAAVADFLSQMNAGSRAPATSETSAPATTTTAVARPVARIPAGSAFSVASSDQVCTDKAKEGQRFRAVLQQTVEGQNGATIPKGSQVTFVVRKLARADGKVEFVVAPESIAADGQSHAVDATTQTVALKAKGRGMLGALAGAAVAAAATRAAGGDTKQTVAGGVVGGAAGAVAGSQVKTGESCIEKNAAIRFTLDSDLTLN